jgi:1-deoxy-D-xylulose-5-phosphate reductoisomerase
VRLFAITPEQIEVVIHPQSIMHSAVEYVDGSVIAQLGTPDMRTAIALALSAPSRMDLPFSRLNLFNQRLEFEPVDHERFLSINFAFEALSKGESACKALNEANEEAVQLFLAGEIGFLEILTRVGKAI